MRLTINLDDDTYAVAKALAAENRTSVSASVNQLIRRALEKSSEPAPRKRYARLRLPVVEGISLVTSAQVKEAELEDNA
jgi:plasmid stability protein